MRGWLAALAVLALQGLAGASHPSNETEEAGPLERSSVPAALVEPAPSPLPRALLAPLGGLAAVGLMVVVMLGGWPRR